MGSALGELVPADRCRGAVARRGAGSGACASGRAAGERGYRPGGGPAGGRGAGRRWWSWPAASSGRWRGHAPTLGRGRAYVTANKALLATHGGELAELATANAGRRCSAVGQRGRRHADDRDRRAPGRHRRIARLRGVAECDHHLHPVRDGQGPRLRRRAARRRSRPATRRPDPTFDVSGRDAAQKLAILASVAWGRWRPEREVETRGIVGIAREPGRDRPAGGGGRRRGHARRSRWSWRPG